MSYVVVELLFPDLLLDLLRNPFEKKETMSDDWDEEIAVAAAPVEVGILG